MSHRAIPSIGSCPNRVVAEAQGLQNRSVCSAQEIGRGGCPFASGTSGRETDQTVAGTIRLPRNPRGR